MSKIGFKGFLVMCLGLMVSASYGNIVIGDFENGSMDGWWNSGSSAVPVEEYSTLGTGSLKAVRDNGGWGGLAEIAVFGTPAQAALGTVGQVTLDVTSFYNVNVDEGLGYCELAILVNCNELWNVYDYKSITSGTTESITFQLPADAMAAILAAPDYANIGILSNSSGDVLSDPDPITGEQTLLLEGETTHYIDNVQVVPEPATMVMLSLGGLALIRKRS